MIQVTNEVQRPLAKRIAVVVAAILLVPGGFYAFQSVREWQQEREWIADCMNDPKETMETCKKLLEDSKEIF